MRGRKQPFKNNQARLNIETLECRLTPSGNTISGFVYYDANANGLFDPGETPIANSSIELHDASNAVVGSTTTDDNGYYQFTTDQSTPTVDATLTKTVSFPETQTNFNLSGVLDQFDPSLGQLESVEIQHAGSITSEIKVENLSADSSSDISGTVSGTLTFTAPNVNDNLAISGYAGSFSADSFDGSNDFAGASGTSFGQKSADGSNSITLTGSDIDPYVGTGTVDVGEQAVATSNATGGGNLEVNVTSTAHSDITVIYHYKAFGPLQPGSYTIVQTHEPDGYTDGLESNNDGVIPNTIGTDTINVGLVDTDVPNNNFGELKPTGISGHVWVDANNDGVRDPSEALIPGVQIELDGAANGPLQTSTDANGFYSFDNLAPGTYTIKETQPTNYLDGKDNAGTLGGTVVNDPNMDQIQNITLNSGDNSENNDFGEIQPASLSGHVYYDVNNNGTFDAGEQPIAGTTVTLTGFDDNGPVNVTAVTDATGTYAFNNLRPGSYAITETQPAGYADGKDSVGSQGGTLGNDVISDINLTAGTAGINNDFGEIKSTNPNPPNPLPKGVNPLGQLPIISKSQLLNDATSDYLDPTIRGQMAFVVGASVTLTGENPDLVGTMNGVQELRSGTSQQDFVNQLWTSDAHRALQVDSAYQTILDRAPTSQEQAAGVAQLKGGSDASVLEQGLYVSAEYQQLHPTSTGLAQALYKDILNTVPDDATTQDLLQSMDSEPLDTVVSGLMNSDGALANKIDDVYHQTVRRAATTAEISTWSTSIKAGTTTLDALSQRLLASSEFYQLTFNTIK